MRLRGPPLLPFYVVLLAAALIAPYLYPPLTPYLFWALVAWLFVSFALFLRPVLARRWRARPLRTSASAAPGTGAAPAPPDGRLLDNLSFCFRCGADLPEHAAACPKCGRRLGIG